MGRTIAPLLTVACSAFAIACVSLAGVTGGNVDSTDAGDAGGSADAGAAGDGGDGGCVAALCDDFEREFLAGAKWEAHWNPNGDDVQLAIDAAEKHSGTRSLRATMPRSGVGGGFVGTRFSSQSGGTLSFWLKMASPSGAIQIARFRLDQGSSGGQLMIATEAGALVLAEQRYANDEFVGYAGYALEGFQPDTWQKWTLELDASKVPAVARVRRDDALVRETALVNPFSKSDLHVHVGIPFVTASAATTLYIDDVTVTLLP